MENGQLNHLDEERDEIDLMEVIRPYLALWPVYLAAIALFLFLSWVYISSVRPKYPVKTSLLFLDQQDKGGAPTVGNMDFGLLATGISNVNVDNEMQIIKSREILQKAVEESNAYVDISNRRGLRSYVWFDELPFTFSMMKSSLDKLKEPYEFKVEPLGNGRYQVVLEEDLMVTIDSIPSTFSTAVGIISMQANPNYNEDRAHLYDYTPLDVEISPPLRLAINLTEKGELSVELASKESSLANISIESEHRGKGEAFLAKLIEVYNRERAVDKDAAAQKTYNFINDRIELIGRELGETEQQLEQVKRSQGVVSYEDLGILVTNSAELEKKRVETETQIRLVDYLLEYLSTSQNQYSLIPGSLGLQDATLQTAVQAYNQKIFERNSLLEGAREDHPAVLSLNNDLIKARENIRDAAQINRQGLEIQLEDVRKQERRYESKIAQAPSFERISTDIERQRAIRSDLYLYLLTKREETSIELAASLQSGRVVDSPLAATVPSSPKKPIIYLAGLLLGLLFPTAVIFIYRLTRVKITTEEDIRALTQIGVLGSIPRMEYDPEAGSEIVVSTRGNNLMTEVFRSLRTNLSFVTANKKPLVALFTSTVSGEGKTFSASNIAVSLSALEERVLIVGLDLRNPQIRRTFGLSDKQSSSKGMSDILNDRSLQPMDYLWESPDYPHLSIIHAGTIPPNPPELLARPRLEEVFEEFRKHFDYIIIDGAPVGPVVDSLVVSRVADVTLYMTRSKATHKHDFEYINYLYRERKLPNINIILNDVDPKGSIFSKGYGYGYGYGYGHKDAKSAKKEKP